MSLYDELEEAGHLILPTDSDATKITTYNYGDTTFPISINIIRMTVEDIILFADENAKYRANLKGTNADQVVQGARVIITSNSKKYEITNLPELHKLFIGFRGLRLKIIND